MPVGRRCENDPLDCLAIDIAPHLGSAAISPSKVGQWRARCPAHDDTNASLSIGLGDQGARIVWHCHRGCDPAEVRTAMIRNGVTDECLPRARGQRTEDEIVSDGLAVLYEDDLPPQVKLLSLAVILGCGGTMPRGPELAELAEAIGLSRATAYRAEKLLAGRAGGQPQPLSSQPGVTATSRGSVKLSAKSQVNGRVTATRFVSQRDDQSPAETNGNAGANGNAVTARLTERRTVTLCEYCGRDISHRRADAKFCNRICKQAKYRLDRKLPSDVASLLALITVGEPHGRWSVGPPHGEGIAG